MVNRKSSSFNQGEVSLTTQLLQGILSGRDVSVLTSRVEFRTLFAKFKRMQEAIQVVAAEASEEARRNPWLAKAKARKAA